MLLAPNIFLLFFLHPFLSVSSVSLMCVVAHTTQYWIMLCTMHIIVCITSSNILSSEMPPRRNHPNIFHSLLCPVINCTGICDRSQLDSSSAPSSTAASGEHDPHGHIPANKVLSVEVETLKLSACHCFPQQVFGRGCCDFIMPIAPNMYGIWLPGEYFSKN